MNSYNEGPLSFYLVVSYSYTVLCISYTGDRFKYSRKTFSSWTTAHRHAKDFPEGKGIPVYYNHGNPEQSVLESGVGYLFYFFLIFALFCGFCAVFYSVYVYRKAEDVRKRYR